MPLPMKKLCCCDGECYVYEDTFGRPGNNVELLEPDWEVCGDWSDWTITPLTNTVPNAVIVLKHMVGNPYGILEIESDVQEGDIKQVIVFKGTESNACGAEDIVVEIEMISNNDGFIRIKEGSTVHAFNLFFTPAPDQLKWTVCVGENAIEAKTETSEVIRHCTTPANHWFALKGVTVGTKWKSVRYSDHYNNNRLCPKCFRACCFPNFDASIIAFIITIDFIGDSSCSCAESITFRVDLGSQFDRCDCNLVYSLPLVPGPHGCGAGVSSVAVNLNCRFSLTEILWSMVFIPDDGFQGETSYGKRFPAGTAPQDISATEESLIFSIGDEQSCIYEGTLITFTPIVVPGCCTEIVLEPEA